MLRRSISVVFALAFLVSAHVSAQTFRGGVSGTLTDASGAIVAGANVKLVSTDTGLNRDTTTSSAGDFVFQDLPLGTYDITVTQSGFDTLHVTGIVVNAGTVNNLALKLDVAKQATTVEVQASAVAIETASAAETSLINTKQILDIPLNGRDFTQLLKLNPGTTVSGSVVGSRTNGIDWKIDGTDNNDLWHNSNAVNQGGVSGIAGVVLPVDAIDEFSLQTSSNAEENRNMGGVLNVVVKSGTNSFHGSLYYFNRNEFFATNNWFTPPGTPNSELRNNQEGGSLGGPIWRNHTFFFMNYEQQNYREALTAVGTTPSAAWVSQASALMTANGVAVNPLAIKLINTLWPANSLNGAATVNNFNGGGINLSNSYNGVVKLDHQFNSKNNIAIRYFGGTGNQVEYVGAAMPYYFQAAPSRMHNFSVVYNAVISPRFVAQTLLGVNYFKQVFGDANHGFDMPALGFNDGVTNPTDFGAPNINISGFDATGDTPPLGRIDTTGHIDQVFTYTAGAHSIRFGADYRRSRLDVFYDANAPGTFTFDGSQGPFAVTCPNDTWNVGGACPAVGSGAVSQAASPNPSLDSLADFLALRVGFQHASVAYGPQQRNYWLNGLSFFGQDTWKVTQRLTLNYGVNWVYQSPVYNYANAISTFIPADGGITYVGTHGLNTLYPRDYHDVAPRLGFAFQPTPGGKLVIRGGWGMFYQVPNVNYFGNSHPGNGAATGINDNIGGPSPVLNLVNQTPLAIQAGVPIFAASEATGPYGAFSVSQHFVTGYSMNTNFNVQYELARNTVAEVGYSGALGRHLPDTLDINQIPAGAPEANSSRPYYAQFPYLAAIDEVQSVGNSNYNGFLASVRMNNLHGFIAKASYTYSHSLDDLSAARNTIPQNSYCLRCDYASSDFDVRHSFSMFLGYNIPQPGRYRLLLGGWQLNTLFTFSAGSPFTINSGQGDTSGTGEGADRAEVIGNPFANVPASDRAASTVYWFNPAAFSVPATGTYSNQGRNEFTGPPIRQIDFSIFKSFSITEHANLQLRAEIFNITNFRNLSTPNNNVYSSGLGTITSTYDVGVTGAPGIGLGAPRNVQLAAKFIF